MVFIVSDWHFCHNRDFIYKPRGFEGVYDMNTAILNKHNAVVGYDDDVYVLGDCMLMDNVTGRALMNQMKGKLHIIRGNHDTEPRMELYNSMWNVVEVCEGKFLNYNGYHFYLSHFPCLIGNIDDGKSLKKKTLCLCGHIHTKNKFSDMDKGPIYHVELDCSNNAPVSLDKIIEDFEYFYALPIEQKKKIVSMEIYNEKN